ncbi:MAG: fibronectin type III domain-containing protein, partial [Fidelibacterota bacterium]
VYVTEAAPVFESCTFRNLAVQPTAVPNDNNQEAPIMLNGSWQFNDPNYYQPKFLNCVIAGNTNGLATGVTNSGISLEGGGIYVGFGMIPVFENTRIDSNTIDPQSGAIGSTWSESNGGGVFIVTYFDNVPAAIQFTNCSISGNKARGMDAQGGGIYLKFPLVEFTNCLITGNSVESVYDLNFQNPDGLGGGIYTFIQAQGQAYPGGGTTYNADTRFINTTVADNTVLQSTGGSWAGAGIFRDNTNTSFTFFNSIIAQNDVLNATASDHENMSTSYGPFGSANVNAAYDLISFATDAGISGSYILEDEPDFLGNGDYSLAISSVAIGKGGATYGSLSAPSTDYYGNSRPTTSYDPGNGTYGPDLGAIENSLTVSPYPNAPENLTVTDENDSTVTLSWTAPADNDLAKYRIYYATSSPAGTLIDSVAGVTTRTVHGLTNGTTYYFRVTAVDLDGYESSFSNEVSGTPSYKGPVWYVDEAVGTIANGKDGSPANPFGDIGDVFSDAPIQAGDTILVLPGTYNDSDDRDLTAPDFPFMLMSRDGPDSTIIDLTQSVGTKYRFFNFNTEVDTTTRIIGFTIQNATGNSGFGGAMSFVGFWDWGQNRFVEANPLIRNCRFINNTTLNGNEGGAVYISSSSPVFEQCDFI